MQLHTIVQCWCCSCSHSVFCTPVAVVVQYSLAVAVSCSLAACPHAHCVFASITEAWGVLQHSDRTAGCGTTLFENSITGFVRSLVTNHYMNVRPTDSHHQGSSACMPASSVLQLPKSLKSFNTSWVWLCWQCANVQHLLQQVGDLRVALSSCRYGVTTTSDRLSKTVVSSGTCAFIADHLLHVALSAV